MTSFVQAYTASERWAVAQTDSPPRYVYLAEFCQLFQKMMGQHFQTWHWGISAHQPISQTDSDIRSTHRLLDSTVTPGQDARELRTRRGLTKEILSPSRQQNTQSSTSQEASSHCWENSDLHDNLELCSHHSLRVQCYVKIKFNILPSQDVKSAIF